MNWTINWAEHFGVWFLFPSVVAVRDRANSIDPHHRLTTGLRFLKWGVELTIEWQP